MENAGGALCERLIEASGEGTVAAVCGPGNNGGDGFAAARRLAERGRDAHILLACPRHSLRGAARKQFDAAEQAGIAVVDISTSGRLDESRPMLERAAMVVDALFGTGLARPLAGHLSGVVAAMNASPGLVVSADVPSGVDADSGRILGAAVAADLTVTFAYPKPGLFLPPGSAHTGKVAVADIGIPVEAEEGIDLPGSLLDGTAVTAVFPPRPRGSHKGDFGHLLVVAGSAGKVGAGILAAEGALRSGAGLVTLALPASAVHVPLSVLPEVMTAPLAETGEGMLALAGRTAAGRLAAERDALAIGPGLGTGEETVEMVRALLGSVEAPAVVDADALNALGSDLVFLRPRGGCTILTPHPGEMGRLLGVTAAEVQADRTGAAVRCARESGCVTVLKGAGTVVAHPDGRWFINPTGNPGMATAGAGDVLTGMIGALLAQGIEPLDAACGAVFLHGRAGDLAAEELTPEAMTARDLAGRIGPALRATRSAQCCGDDPRLTAGAR